MKIKNRVVKTDLMNSHRGEERTATDSVSCITPDGLILKAEVHDSRKGFFRRIKILFRGKIVACGEWNSYFEGMATLMYNRRMFILPTSYWEGYLPIEQVCEVITFFSTRPIQRQGGDKASGKVKRGKKS